MFDCLNVLVRSLLSVAVCLLAFASVGAWVRCSCCPLRLFALCVRMHNRRGREEEEHKEDATKTAQGGEEEEEKEEEDEENNKKKNKKR